MWPASKTVQTTGGHKSSPHPKQCYILSKIGRNVSWGQRGGGGGEGGKNC